MNHQYEVDLDERNLGGVIGDPNDIYYAEEASLYSIAEDSREERESEFTPSSGLAARDALNTSLGGGVLPADSEMGSRGVELQLESMDRVNRINNSSDDDNLTKVSDNQLYAYYEVRNRRCKNFAIGCIIFILLISVVALAVMLAQKQQGESRDVSAITTGQGESESEPSSVDVYPTLSPATPVPTTDAKYELSENYVYNSINQCPGDGTFFDESTPQGRVFRSLVKQVYEGASQDSAIGEIVFDEMHSAEFLKETYALSILYYSTEGDSWTNDASWLSETDPCKWYGIKCTPVWKRLPGKCAVTSIELSDNNLGGSLPEEFCCMSCLKHIGMANNKIGGSILTCLNQITTLETVDFVNNQFVSTSFAASIQTAEPDP